MTQIETEIDWPSEKQGPWRIGLVWEAINGRLECISLTLRPHPSASPRPIHTADIRNLRLREVIERSRRQLAEEVEFARVSQRAVELLLEFAQRRADDPWDESDRARALADVARLQPALRRAAEECQELKAVQLPTSNRGRPPLYGREHFVEVATVYTETYLRGAQPTRAVAERFHVQRSTAAKWVARCRALGLLGTTDRRKAGGILTADERPRKEDE